LVNVSLNQPTWVASLNEMYHQTYIFIKTCGFSNSNGNKSSWNQLMVYAAGRQTNME